MIEMMTAFSISVFSMPLLIIFIVTEEHYTKLCISLGQFIIGYFVFHLIRLAQMNISWKIMKAHHIFSIIFIFYALWSNQVEYIFILGAASLTSLTRCIRQLQIIRTSPFKKMDLILSVVGAFGQLLIVAYGLVYYSIIDNDEMSVIKTIIVVPLAVVVVVFASKQAQSMNFK